MKPKKNCVTYLKRKMSKLDDYISGKIKFPIKRTGLSNDDFVVQPWKMKAENITYNCSLCGCVIRHNNFFFTHIERGYTVPREGINGIRNESEILGFTCRTCYDEIAEYDSLSYG